jgi:hypothetical protein
MNRDLVASWYSDRIAGFYNGQEAATDGAVYMLSESPTLQPGLCVSEVCPPLCEWRKHGVQMESFWYMASQIRFCSNEGAYLRASHAEILALPLV